MFHNLLAAYAASTKKCPLVLRRTPAPGERWTPTFSIGNRDTDRVFDLDAFLVLISLFCVRKVHPPSRLK